MSQGFEILCKTRLFFYIFNGNLYFDALNLELFQICLLISPSLREDLL